MLAYLITRVFKAISVQALIDEAYLTFISLELDKKIDWIVTCLCSGLLYHMLTQSRLTHPRWIFTPLEVFEKCYAKLFGNNIYKVKNKPAYIIAS